jgi:hypothetical protein
MAKENRTSGLVERVLRARPFFGRLGARGGLPLLAVVTVYLVLALLWMLPVSLDPTALAFNAGDPLHLGWVMAWDAHQIVRAPWALFDSNSFYPYPRSLTFGDHLLPEALMVAPLFWLSGNAVLGFNAAVLLGLLLSAMAMFLLVRELTDSAPAAFVAGVIFAFNGFTQHELPRVQVIHLEWWPLALLFLVRFTREGRSRDAALLAVTLALQGLSGTYYLVYSALLVPLWLLAGWIAARRWPRAVELRRLALSGVLAASAVALVLWPYVATYRAIGFANAWGDGIDVLGLLDVRCSWLWGRWLGTAPSATPAFVGLLGAVALVIGLSRAIAGRRDSQARVMLALTVLPLVVGLVLSWGTTVRLGGWALGPGPAEWLHRHVPLLRGMGGAERAGVLVRLAVAILIGFAVAQGLRALPRLRAIGAGVLVALLLVLEQWSLPAAATRVPTGAQVPAEYRYLADGSREPMVELPPHRGTSQKLWSAYLYFSTYHWRPVPIGRTSLYPPAHNWIIWTLRGFPDDRSLDLLERLGIRTVLVHPMGWYLERERASRLAAVESSPRIELLRRFDEPVAQDFVDVFRLGNARVYRVLPTSKAEVSPCQPREEIERESWRFRVAEGDPPPLYMRDGDPRTAWTLREEGRKTLQVSLRRTEPLSAIALEVAYPWAALPPGADLEVRAEREGPWEPVAYDDGIEERWEVIKAQIAAPHSVRWTLRFGPRRVNAIRLTAGSEGTQGPYGPWSIGELRMYRRCDALTGEKARGAVPEKIERAGSDSTSGRPDSTAR